MYHHQDTKAQRKEDYPISVLVLKILIVSPPRHEGTKKRRLSYICLCVFVSLCLKYSMYHHQDTKAQRKETIICSANLGELLEKHDRALSQPLKN
jgi:hypothetical protein